MSYLKSYIMNKIREYKRLLAITNHNIEKTHSMKEFDKLQIQRKMYIIILQEFDMLLTLIEEEF